MPRGPRTDERQRDSLRPVPPTRRAVGDGAVKFFDRLFRRPPPAPRNPILVDGFTDGHRTCAVYLLDGGGAEVRVDDGELRNPPAVSWTLAREQVRSGDAWTPPEVGQWMRDSLVEAINRARELADSLEGGAR